MAANKSQSSCQKANENLSLELPFEKFKEEEVPVRPVAMFKLCEERLVINNQSKLFLEKHYGPIPTEPFVL